MNDAAQVVGRARAFQNNQVAFTKKRAEKLGRALHIRKYMEAMGIFLPFGSKSMSRHRSDKDDMISDLQCCFGDARIDLCGCPAVVGYGADDDDLSLGVGRL